MPPSGGFFMPQPPCAKKKILISVSLYLTVFFYCILTLNQVSKRFGMDLQQGRGLYPSKEERRFYIRKLRAQADAGDPLSIKILLELDDRRRASSELNVLLSRDSTANKKAK